MYITSNLNKLHSKYLIMHTHVLTQYLFFIYIPLYFTSNYMSLFQRIISNVLEVMVTKSPATVVYSIIRKTWYKL